MNRSQFFATLLAIGLAAGHFFFLLEHCPPSFMGPDANGYFVQAALLAIEDPDLLTAVMRPEGLIRATNEDFDSIEGLARDLGFLR